MKRLITDKSINQIAQEEGCTSQNEANRIRERERRVKTSWRQFAFETNCQTVSAREIAASTSLPIEYVKIICERNGYAVKD